MPINQQELELHVVIQCGGSTDEHYLHTFESEALALKYVRSADEASYRCLGPFTIALHGARRLIDTAKRATRWLTSNGFEGTPIVSKLEKALSQFERGRAKTKKE